MILDVEIPHIDVEVGNIGDTEIHGINVEVGNDNTEVNNVEILICLRNQFKFQIPSDYRS